MHACDGRTDGRTEFSSLYRVCITCSAVIKLCQEIEVLVDQVKKDIIIIGDFNFPDTDWDIH